MRMGIIDMMMKVLLCSCVLCTDLMLIIMLVMIGMMIKMLLYACVLATSCATPR